MIVGCNNEITEVNYSGYTIDKIYACGGQLVYEGGHDYSRDYLTFTATGERKGYMKLTRNLNNNEWVEYWTDLSHSWNRISNNTSDITARIPLMNGPVKIRGIIKSSVGFITHYQQEPSLEEIHFDAAGNIMSLFYGDDFIGKTSFPSGIIQCCYNMFRDLYIDNAKNLILPATTFPSMCYMYMFRDCKSLKTAPDLPSTALTDYCYTAMFRGCTSLTKAPALPASVLADKCYQYMFHDCASLTTAPELPATVLADSCYQNMFYGCASLTTAPILSATTLQRQCYQYMFFGCTSLNYIKCLATNISASYCTYLWVFGVSLSGTFVKAEGMTGWPRGDNGIPNGWSVENNN